MKKLFFLTALFLITTFSFGQHKTFETLRNKFGGRDNVFSFSTSGFLARTVLWMAGENDFRDAIIDLKKVRFITIPKSEFAADQVTVKGLKKLILRDNYQELVSIKDRRDDVTIYLSESTGERNNRYFILIDNENEVVAVEMKGFIDVETLNKQARLSYNH